MIKNHGGKHSEHKQHISGAVHYLFLALFLALQIAVMCLSFFVLRMSFSYFYLICEILSVFVVLYIVRADTNPSYKIPWIILALLFPILGGLSYLMFGRVRFSRSERRRSAAIQRNYSNAMLGKRDCLENLEKENESLAMQARYIRSHADAPLFSNTSVEYFPLGEDMFEKMLPELEAAEKFIFLEYFIIHPGKMWNAIEDILVEKAAKGVDVRVIYDDIGSIGLVPTDFIRQLKDKGIKACAFNPLTTVLSARFNNRDHRKICVIDGNVGFTGGINLADEYINEKVKYGHWKDTAVMLKGSGVWGLTSLFLTLWDFEYKQSETFRKFMPTKTVEAPGYVQPFTDSPFDTERVGETVYMNMLYRARRYVYITTPYLIIDDEMTMALSVASKSGVDVRIITPGVPDKRLAYALTRSYYEVLLKSGVRIYEYTPGFIHAKEFVSDDRCAVVGTINLDYRSLCHHYECAVWMCNVPAIADIKADFMDAMSKSHEVTLDASRNNSLPWKILLSVLRVLAPLF